MDGFALFELDRKIQEGVFKSPDMPDRPDRFYGVSKAFGEDLG
mgnify:CR=1 FL=1